ncbi:MAG: FAD-binding oxidoreductase [bacterium]|nr:FAD-binding oxidoreductase [bacterium]
MRSVPLGHPSVSGRTDVLIVGGGIVGAACAAACAQAGLTVALVEADLAVGMDATAAGMGQIVAMDGSPAELALTRYSQRLWDDLARSLPEDCEYERCGTLWIAADDDEMEEAARKATRYHEHALQAELLEQRDLYALEPALRPGLAGGLCVPGDSILYAPRAAAALLAEAERHGARALFGCRVRALHEGEVELDDGARMAARTVVLATGARAAELIPELPIRPRTGHLVITERYPALVRHQLVELGYVKSAHGTDADSVAFNLQPRPTGQLLIGSSRQYGRADPAVDRVIVARMLKRAIAYLPVLHGLDALRVWTGQRAATLDGLPYIGPCPGRAWLFVAAGHEGLGITAALATARLLSDHLLGRAPEIAPEPYSPARAWLETVVRA